MANEKRLIDANALRKRMFSYYSCVDENSSKEYYKGDTLMSYEVADMIEDCIDNAPTVDAVEVVRCKDCKNAMLLRKPEGKLIADCFIRKMNSEDEQFCMVGADDFCSYGERKDND